MNKFGNLFKKGPWIHLKLNEHGLELLNTSNNVLDDILQRYEVYLIDNQVCPQCYDDLSKDQAEQSYHPRCGWGID
jgi:hypothetical protein